MKNSTRTIFSHGASGYFSEPGPFDIVFTYSQDYTWNEISSHDPNIAELRPKLEGWVKVKAGTNGERTYMTWDPPGISSAQAPETSTLTLAIFGLLGLLPLGRRRR